MPSWIWWVIVALALVAAAWAYLTAQRLDRLHRKVFASRTGLDTQLAHRAGLSAHLSTSGLLDPASSLLVGAAAWNAQAAAGHGSAELAVALPQLGPANQPAGAAMPSDRAQAESDLSKVWRDVLADPQQLEVLAADPLARHALGDLAATWQRVQIARRFHNESVVQSRDLRRRVLVRVLGLAGHAPLPVPVDFDDVCPGGLAQFEIA